MFDEASAEAGTLARETAVRACWDQWSALGSLAVAHERRPPGSIIDPEALVLTSLWLRRFELRLGDLVAWWAETSSHLMSVQRLRTLAKRFPPAEDDGLVAQFAWLANAAGDRRWLRHTGGATVEWVRPAKPRPAPDLLVPRALWPRLRAGLGVGTKADVLVFLLGLRGTSATVPRIAAATRYTQPAVRKAAHDMSMARLLREARSRPVEYLAPPGPWVDLLELAPVAGETDHGSDPGPPRWRYWADVFAFLTAVAHWARAAKVADSTEMHTWASRARDLVKTYAGIFDVAGVAAPSMDRFRGRDAVLGLLETTRSLARWVDEAD